MLKKKKKNFFKNDKTEAETENEHVNQQNEKRMIGHFHTVLIH